MTNPLDAITRLKEELDALRPLASDVLGQVEQKLRLEANYNSNAIEGNTLNYGETRNLILYGLTAQGKPMRDHLDIEGHDMAVKAIEDVISDDHELNEVFIRNLHRILLKEPYEKEAETPDGRRVRRTIAVGDYKTAPNNVRTSTGETYYFTPPDQVKSAMSDLIDWYKSKEREGEHPIIIAATFHYRFVRIHPFDDGNGRMARLLMNMILIKHGYTVSLIRHENRDEYLGQLERADKTEDLTEFISYIANSCEYSLVLHLKAARGESIEEIEDIDKEIALFKSSLVNAEEQIPLATEYLDSILYPFYDYYMSKVRKFSDSFAYIRASHAMQATTVNGSKVALSMKENSTTSLVDDIGVPGPLRSVSFDNAIWMDPFNANQMNSFEVRIRNYIDAHHCQWTFSIDVLGVELNHEGRDLEALKRQFNEFLRRMMKELKQRYR